MERLAPVGPVYQAGTLSGNPVAVAAGIAALDLAAEEQPYRGAHRLSSDAGRRPQRTDARRRHPRAVNRVASMFSLFFTDAPVRNFADAKAADHDRYARFFHHMLDRGVYLPPSGYETVERLHRARRRDDRADARCRGVVRGLARSEPRPSRDGGTLHVLADVDVVDVRRDAIRPRHLPEPIGDGSYSAADADPIALQRERRGRRRARRCAHPARWRSGPRARTPPTGHDLRQASAGRPITGPPCRSR